MASSIIVENLSKIYRLGEIGTGTISQDIERFIKTKILKQEDPFLKIGETNNRVNKSKSDIVYSLKDINFEIEQGDAIGIVGKNGAGKSTLLKVLSRITSPSKGKVKINGRVASLLEVGTGFHPELTGRENIYLNGAILGMRKKEIDLKFDEIVDFSGVEKYIDTPVKRYSSGMYVRLAFSVAAHLESEILIVDEVLAVGDAEFQRKCLGKMGDVSTKNGKTLLFVSHNLNAIKSLCHKSIFLENGLLKMDNLTTKVIDSYLGNDLNTSIIYVNLSDYKTEKINLINAKLYSSDKIDPSQFSVNDDLFLEIKYLINEKIEGLGFTLIVYNQDNEIVFGSVNEFEKMYKANLNIGNYTTMVKIPKNLLNNKRYYFEVNIFDNYFQSIFSLKNLFSFDIEDSLVCRNDFLGEYMGDIRPLLNWETINK
jgi:lipopolysaccharide transport system ATP-binding protein